MSTLPPLTAIPRTESIDVRQVICTLARHFVGCGAADRRVEFEALLGPTIGRWDLERPFSCRRLPDGRYQTQGVSTCGLVAEGLWRLAGVRTPPSWDVYAPTCDAQRAIARARIFGRENNAVIKPEVGADMRPEPGDYLCLGIALGEHVCTVVGWEDSPSGEPVCVTVDGGQVDQSRLQTVALRRRVWSSAPMPSLGTRPVNWWVAVDLLPWRGQVVVPTIATVSP
jgi:hypothetical protein